MATRKKLTAQFTHVKRPKKHVLQPPTQDSDFSGTTAPALNMAIIDMSDEPRLEELKTHKKYKSDIFKKYDLKKACLHDHHVKMTILQANRKCQPGQTTHDNLPAYFVGVSTTHPTDRQSYILLKEPTSKSHV